MAVRIRMKRLGRAHRPFFRICAMDQRAPRDGRVLEELGTYDPMVPETDARAILKADRIDYWLGVGALPSEKVAVLIKKYGSAGTHVDAQKGAIERLAQPKGVPDPGLPAKSRKSNQEVESESAAAADETDAGEAATAEETAPEEPTPEETAVAE